MGRVKRLGLLGGTFNPPHLGHLLLGESAREQLGLERVLFLPAGQPPHKEGEPVTAPHHRLAMTRLAIESNPSFEVNTTDIKRPPPHYTSTLLSLIAATYPGHELWLLVGGDSLRDLPTWHHPREVIAHTRLGVLARPGVQYNWSYLERAVPGVRAKTTMLEGPSIAISSTQIRAWATTGRSLRYLTPEPVRAYILREELYQETER